MRSYFYDLKRENRRYFVFSAIGTLIRVGILFLLYWVASRTVGSALGWYRILIVGYAVIEVLILLTKSHWFLHKLFLLQSASDRDYIDE